MVSLTEKMFKHMAESCIERANTSLDEDLMYSVEVDGMSLPGDGGFEQFHLTIEKLMEMTNFVPCDVEPSLIKDLLNNVRHQYIQWRGGKLEIVQFQFGYPIDFRAIDSFYKIDNEIYKHISLESPYYFSEEEFHLYYTLKNFDGRGNSTFEMAYQIVLDRMYKRYHSKEKFIKTVRKKVTTHPDSSILDIEAQEKIISILSDHKDIIFLKDGTTIVLFDGLDRMISREVERGRTCLD